MYTRSRIRPSHNKYKHQARVLWLSADLRVQRRSVTHVKLQGCALGEGD